MKLKSLMLAAAVAAVPAIALAQSAPSPSNQSGPGVSPTTQSPTDMGQGSEGNVKGIPSRDTNTMGTGQGGAMQGTTGSAAGESKTMESQKKTVSPASPDEGNQKLK